MSAVTLNRIAIAFDLLESKSGFYLSIDNRVGLTATRDSQLEATCQQVAERLIYELSAFTALDKLPGTLPKSPLVKLKEKALTFFAGKLPENSPQLYDLKKFYFPAAIARWKLERGYAKEPTIQCDPDGDSLIGEEILADNSKKLNKTDFKILTYPRDLLFVEKQVLFYLKQLATIQCAIAQRVNKWHASGLKVSYLGQSQGEQALCYTIEGLESELLVQTQRTSVRLVQNKDEYLLSNAVKKIWAYTQEPSYNKQLSDLCIELLETNELLYMNRQLVAEWRKFEYIAEGLTEVETHKKLFETKSYLPRRRLAYLLETTKWLISYAATLPKEPIAERFSKQENAAGYCLIALQSLESKLEDSTEFYAQLAKRTSKAIQDSGNSRDIYSRFEQILFRSTEYYFGEEGYEEYTFNPITPKAYEETLSAINRLSMGISLNVPTLVQEFESSPKTQSQDKGFAVTLPPRAPQRAASLKKRKKSLTPPTSTNTSRSVSPETANSPPQLPVDEVTKLVANLTLAPKVKSTVSVQPLKKIPRKSPSLPKAPEAQEISAKLRYDPRVLRWFKDDTILTKDPEYTSLPYSKKLQKWIYAEHNFARYADFYLRCGATDPDKARLDRLGVIERIQLLGDITIQFAKGVETKKGAFTFSKGDDGMYYHRTFTPLDREEPVDADYAKKAWKLLETTPIPKEAKSKPTVVAKDKSFLESETGDLVVLVDPKNNAFIRIVKRLSNA